MNGTRKGFLLLQTFQNVRNVRLLPPLSTRFKVTNCVTMRSSDGSHVIEMNLIRFTATTNILSLPLGHECIRAGLHLTEQHISVDASPLEKQERLNQHCPGIKQKSLITVQLQP